MKHSDARLAQASGAGAPDAHRRDVDPSPADSEASPHAVGPSPAFVEHARSLLTTRHLGRVIQAFGEVDSSNSLAAEWIEKGAPHGAVVIADYQIRGRGRLGRSWIAAAGLNLTFSVVLHPHLPSDRLGMLTIAACTGVARALDRFANPLRTTVKWPNDIYLGDRKLCGMLLEASWNVPGRNPAVVLGIGLNVNQDEFPEEIRQGATSLLMETGRITPRAELFAAALSDLEDSLDRVAENEGDVRQDYVDRMMSLNESISLRSSTTNRRVEGVVRGLDASGGIIIESNAQRRVYHAGEMTRSV